MKLKEFLHFLFCAYLNSPHMLIVTCGKICMTQLWADKSLIKTHTKYLTFWILKRGFKRRTCWANADWCLEPGAENQELRTSLSRNTMRSWRSWLHIKEGFWNKCIFDGNKIRIRFKESLPFHILCIWAQRWL